MSCCRLRVYYGPQEETVATAISRVESKCETVKVALGDVLPLLVDAVQGERTWLRDFADDEISISTDFYEVLLAYQHFRRPSA